MLSLAVITVGRPQMLQIYDVRHDGATLSPSYPVSVALGPVGEWLPNPATWYTAEWAGPGVVQILIGGNGVMPGAGEYVVYLGIDADPEMPAFPVGRLSMRQGEAP